MSSGFGEACNVLWVMALRVMHGEVVGKIKKQGKIRLVMKSAFSRRT